MNRLKPAKPNESNRFQRLGNFIFMKKKLKTASFWPVGGSETMKWFCFASVICIEGTKQKSNADGHGHHGGDQTAQEEDLGGRQCKAAIPIPRVLTRDNAAAEKHQTLPIYPLSTACNKIEPLRSLASEFPSIDRVLKETTSLNGGVSLLAISSGALTGRSGNGRGLRRVLTQSKPTPYLIK